MSNLECMKDITVLVIDEHPEVNSRLAHGLSGMAGFRVVAHTTNPVLAAEFAHQRKPQIVLADFKRGPRPRCEMARWMKETSPGSQVVIFTSYYADDERDEFLAAGAVRCLLKGLTLNELATELRSIALVETALDARPVKGKAR